METQRNLAEIRFLIIGCGSIGRRHIGNLRALGMQNIIGCDTSEERRVRAARDFGIETVAELESGWERSPEAVFITAPTSLHLPLALEAACRGCHLLIEKPLSHSWDGIATLLEVAKSKRVISLIGCNLRFHPGLVAVKKLLTDNVVGRIVAARVEVGQYLPDWHPQEDYRLSYSARRELGGGVILDAIHEIDYVRWLLGEISATACIAGKLSRLEIDTEDTAAILLRCETGAVGEVHLDYVQRAYRRTCQIIGDEGTIHWDYAAPEVRWYSGRTGGWQSVPIPPEWIPNDMYMDEVKHFLACLRGEQDSVLDIEAAARVLRIALAAKKSAEQQKWIEPGSPSWNMHATL